jgi:hypothetical protein
MFSCCKLFEGVRFLYFGFIGTKTIPKTLIPEGVKLSIIIGIAYGEIFW